jgi:hypothetical protein
VTPTTEQLRAAALAYAAAGWPVIPLHHVRGGPDGKPRCSCLEGGNCRSPGKHPLDTDWPNRWSKSAPDIYAWWEQHPSANVGIVTGAPSGIWAFDIDPAGGGLASLVDLTAEHGPMPPTRRHETGNAGLHYLFTVPDGVTIPSSAKTLGPGIDTRGDGGMIVAPPSVSGYGAYAVVSDTDPQPAPGWLLERLAEIQDRRQAGREIEPVEGEPLDIDALPVALRNRLADLDVPDRSTHFHGTVAACRRAGLSQAHTVTALGLWCEQVGKYTGRVAAEVARSWGKLDDADPANSVEAWLDTATAPQDDLSRLVGLARAYQDVPDPGHILLALAVAATRDVNDDPVWLLIVAPPSSGKTETVRGLGMCADAHLDDVSAAGLLSWKTGKNPHPVGVLTRVGERALLTFGDLSTLLASSDRGGRDITFAVLRRVYDGHVVRDLGTAPESLSWQGKVTVVGAVTGIIDNYAAHADALGPRWVYFRLPGRSTEAKRQAAALARHGEIAALREAFAAEAARIVYRARAVIDTVILSEAVYEAVENAAIVTCWGRAAVPRHGYGRREIDGVSLVEEPPRLVKQLLGIARGLSAIGLPEERAISLVRRVAVDSMPASRYAVLRVLATSDVALATAEVARRGDLDRHVARRRLEELELVGVVGAQRVGPEPDEQEPDRRPALWSLIGADGDLVAETISAVIKDQTEEVDRKVTLHTPSPPIRGEDPLGTTYISNHPPTLSVPSDTPPPPSHVSVHTTPSHVSVHPFDWNGSPTSAPDAL